MIFVSKTPTPMHRSWGFTLIEIVLTIVIISVGLFGMMGLFSNVTRGALEGDINIMAVYLARDRLERLVADKVYLTYDNVVNSRYVTSEPVLLGINNFVREFNIYEVSKTDILTPQLNSGFKRIDMTVRWGPDATQTITESTLLTKY